MLRFLLYSAFALVLFSFLYFGNFPKAQNAKITEASSLMKNGNAESALEILSELGKNGNADAIYEMATIYRNGNAVPSDISKAIELYENAADKGHIESQNSLGYIYSRKKFGKLNAEKAIYWFSQAADSGSSIAAFNMGFMYYHGHLVEEDLESSQKYFQRIKDGPHYADAKWHLEKLEILVPRFIEQRKRKENPIFWAVAVRNDNRRHSVGKGSTEKEARSAAIDTCHSKNSDPKYQCKVFHTHSAYGEEYCVHVTHGFVGVGNLSRSGFRGFNTFSIGAYAGIKTNTRTGRPEEFTAAEYARTSANDECKRQAGGSMIECRRYDTDGSSTYCSSHFR